MGYFGEYENIRYLHEGKGEENLRFRRNSRM